jgi:hypothetical protein
LYFAPFSLIGTSVAQVFFQEAEQKKKDGLLAPMVEDVTYALATGCYVPGCGVDGFRAGNIYGDFWFQLG